MHRKRIVSLFLAGVIATMSAATAVAVAANLTGAGSTLVQPLMARWTSDFQHRTGLSVLYSGVGSGAGIQDVTSRSVDFGASDAPLTPAQAAACHSCVQIPWALTATAIGYHLNGVRGLHLSGPVLAKIYLGQITNWSSPAIKALNKGKSLPNLAITPIYRSDGSGDTYAFTDFLAKTSSAWRGRVGRGTAVSFPAGHGLKGNSGVTQGVAGTNGAVGYIAASYLILHGVPAAALQNAAGRYEYPNLKNIASAAKSVKRVPGNNEMHIVYPSAAYALAYPLSTFTYAIVPKSSSHNGVMARFVRYAVGAGQAFGPSLDFSGLPTVVKKAALKTAKVLH
ncbi:MAG: phosphate transport system substrate-binding protein [Solirubrobacteraceae bacterium]|nr:phosphate transport system substrate-binding protein [Solirubrobacteraceae bacterium]